MLCFCWASFRCWSGSLLLCQSSLGIAKAKVLVRLASNLVLPAVPGRHRVRVHIKWLEETPFPQLHKHAGGYSEHHLCNIGAASRGCWGGLWRLCSSSIAVSAASAGTETSSLQAQDKVGHSLSSAEKVISFLCLHVKCLTKPAALTN